MKLKNKIAAVILSCIVLTVLLCVVVVIRIAGFSGSDFFRDYMENTTYLFAQSVQLYFDNQISDITELASDRDVSAAFSEASSGTTGMINQKNARQLQNIIRRKVTSIAGLEAVYFGNADNIIFCSSLFSEGREKILPVVSSGMFSMQQPVITGQYLDTSAFKGKNFFSVLMPMYDYANNYTGCIIYQYSLAFFRTLAGSLHLFPGSYVFIIDQFGGFVVNGKSIVPNVDELNSRENTDFTRQIYDRDFKARPTGVVSYSIGTEKKRAYYKWLPQSGWTVFASVPVSVMKMPVRMLDRVLLVLCLLIPLAGLKFSSVFAAGIRKSDEQFKNVIRAIQDGDMTVRADTAGDEDHAYYRTAFNHLIDYMETRISELDKRAAELSQSNERYRIITDYTKEIIFEWDFGSDEADYSFTWWKKFGYDPVMKNVSKDWPLCDYIHPDDLSIFKEWVAKIYRGATNSKEEFRVKTVDDEFYWIRARTVPIFDRDNKPVKLVGLMQDIDDSKKKENELIQRADFDYLAQVYTRSAFELRVNELIAKNVQFALMYIDIDDFRIFNTKFGHEFGDRVITFIGSRVLSCVGKTGFAGRVGGDEFIICVTDSTVIETIDKLAETILDSLKGGLRVREAEGVVVVQCSIGIVYYPKHGSTFEELSSRADKSMYEVKHSGKNNYTIAM